MTSESVYDNLAYLPEDKAYVSLEALTFIPL